jgi:hypothetical protein
LAQIKAAAVHAVNIPIAGSLTAESNPAAIQRPDGTQVAIAIRGELGQAVGTGFESLKAGQIHDKNFTVSGADRRKCQPFSIG